MCKPGRAGLRAAARAGPRAPASRPQPRRICTIGCLSSASSVTGARPSSAASAASRANTPAGVSAQRVTAGIVNRHVPARHRRQHAAGERPVGRHQRGGLAGIVHRLAQRDRNRQRLLLGVGGLDHRDAGKRGIGMSGEAGVRQALLPKLAGRGRPQRLRRQAFAAVRLGRRERSRPVADECRSAAAAPTWRTADGRCAASLSPSPAGDHRPGRFVEIGVEAGQHQRAVRQLRDGGEQCRGRRDRAGRACRDHRAGAGLQAAWLRPRSACRGVRPARCSSFPSRMRRQCGR